MGLTFRKYHGLGNDFIVLDGITSGLPLDLLHRAAPGLCHRHTGIGADGLLLVLPAVEPGSNARMRVINADGSEPEICGNGIRCVAKALHDHVEGFRGLGSITIDTGAGPLRCDLTVGQDGLVGSVRVDMGHPDLKRSALPMVGQGPFVEQPIEETAGPSPPGPRLRWTAVSMGNPHIVAFVDDPAQDLRALAEALGPRMEHHPLFPNRTNVELVRLGPQEAEAETWVWERGCGITQACGTGACAVAVAAVETGRHSADRELAVRLPGGALRVKVDPDRQRVWMDGPAVEVFEGLVDL